MPTLAQGLTAMRTAISDQMKNADGLSEIVGVQDIYVFDKFPDARPLNFEDESNMETRVGLVPSNHSVEPNYANGEIKIVRRHELFVGSGSIKVSESELLEGILITALTRLKKFLTNDLQPINPDDFLPLRVEELCLLGTSSLDREPIIEPEEFQQLFDITQIAYVKVADLTTA